MVSGFPHIPGSVSHLKRNILNSFIILFELKAQQVYHFSLLTMFLSLCPAEMFFLSEVLIKTFCLPPYLLVITCLGEVKHNRAILTSETALVCWSYFPQVFKKNKMNITYKIKVSFDNRHKPLFIQSPRQSLSSLCGIPFLCTLFHFSLHMQTCTIYYSWSVP